MMSDQLAVLFELRGAVEALKEGDVETALATFEPYVEQLEVEWAVRTLLEDPS